MNFLGIDYGTKQIGLAISINGVISPLKSQVNNKNLFNHLKIIIQEYDISKIYIGLSSGNIGRLTLAFAKDLSTMLQLPVETVEEAVSTIEADEIYQDNKGKKKNYKKQIDSVAAAVILRRVSA